MGTQRAQSTSQKDLIYGIHISSECLFSKNYIYSYISCVEAGSNTSTVTLRVVRGGEKGSLESETVKYCHESHGTGTRK
jgi:hypothetical protein